MKRLLALAVITLAALSAGTAQASPTYARTCLELTTTHSLNTDAITTGLGLPRTTTLAVRARLTKYGTPGFTLDGLGLTSALLAEINRRIAIQVAEMNRYPLGWPCKPFTNPTRVIGFMRAKLVYNGFRPNMTVRLLTTRQIRFLAIQDGQRYIVNVARSDVRQLKVAVICATQYCTGATTAKFNLGFDA